MVEFIHGPVFRGLSAKHWFVHSGRASLPDVMQKSG
jgi:hypothetical protein